MMDKLQRLRNEFANHRAMVLHDDENFLVLKWQDKNGSGNYVVKYIVDKAWGTLYIDGDLGCAVACWYGKVTTENIFDYINTKSIGYFVSKIQCSTDKYSYDDEDVKEDVASVLQEILSEDDYTDSEIEKIKEDFDSIEEMLLDMEDRRVNFSQELIDLISKYNAEWWESSLLHAGRRINDRVYLWSIGFEMAYNDAFSEK